MAEDAIKAESETDKKILHVYPLVKHSDMNEEMRTEAIELCITACEKFAQNYEQAAKLIKETMDKKFGSFWHVVVGEGFGFELSYETKNILYLFFGGNLAIILWKCS
ncbi:Dynein light chain [Sergentomyia squamirostris]|uniref:Dynein light chain n=2 Tax=Phlebotominae TaxID=7198 RepID=A0A1B0CB89_LUTLO|nr:dynein axonemal light chain 4 [Lutzomyia longipalpis]XP_055700743.1 dynein axonemal light chain 4 [Phlebotomus papatasi]XP_059619977.1 dynein axonemal light chain 4 [Phlebotomus argentipes]